jgi:hypothetical protein
MTAVLIHFVIFPLIKLFFLTLHIEISAISLWIPMIFLFLCVIFFLFSTVSKAILNVLFAIWEHIRVLSWCLSHIMNRWHRSSFNEFIKVILNLRHHHVKYIIFLFLLEFNHVWRILLNYFHKVIKSIIFVLLLRIYFLLF